MQPARSNQQGDAYADPLPGYDFRRADAVPREHVRALSAAHEVFARRFATSLGTAIRALVQLEPAGVDQMTFDDYVRSMPDPTLVGVAMLPPLPGAVTLELDAQLALLLVDRLLGGGADSDGGLDMRRPTELEGFLLRDLLAHGVAALREALAPLVPVEAELEALEYTSQQVQVAAPSEMVLLLSYRLAVSQGLETEGLLTLCYPAAALAPLLERLNRQQFNGDDEIQHGVDEAARQALVGHLHDVDVSLAVRLRDSRVPARELASLRVGDVLRLDHRADEPVRLRAGAVEILRGHLGRRGRRLAVQIDSWNVPS